MQSTLNEPDAAAWEQIAPLLDEAMGRLGETDRNAIVLRFFENKTAQEVAATLKLNEAAAHKRVNRAVEKLRKFFTKRGVTLSATLIAGAVSANSVQAAPVGLAMTISATAAKGAAVAATVTTLVQGTLKLMTYAKLKLAIGISAALLLAGGAITIAISETNSIDNLPPKEIVKKALEKYASLTSYSDTGKTVTVRNGKTNMVATFEIRLGRTNLYRIEWELTSPPAIPTKGAVWSAGDGDFSLFGETSFGPPTRYQKKQDMKAALDEAGLSGRGAANAFFNLGTSLNALASGTRISIKKQNDEKIGGIGCFVITGKANSLTRTVWIGKQDFLLHQSQTIEKPPTPMPAANPALDAEFEREAKDILAKIHKEATPEAIASKKKEIKQWMEETSRSMNVLTETHENIVVNESFAKADFIHPVPADLKLENAN